MHSYFAKWGEPHKEGTSLLEQALKNQVGAAREKQGRSASSAFLIVDAQSVKNTDTAGLKGYDAGKKVSGIERHMAVDTQGLPHAVAVSTANVTDRSAQSYRRPPLAPTPADSHCPSACRLRLFTILRLFAALAGQRAR